MNEIPALLCHVRATRKGDLVGTILRVRVSSATALIRWPTGKETWEPFESLEYVSR